MMVKRRRLASAGVMPDSPETAPSVAAESPLDAPRSVRLNLPVLRPRTLVAASVSLLAGLGVFLSLWLIQPRPRRAAVQAAAAAAPIAPVPAPVTAHAPAPPQFQEALRTLTQGFRGDAGAAVFDLKNGWIASSQGDRAFPQQSVSKLWVAVALLDQVDHGRIDLNKVVTIHREDLSLFSEPIQALVTPVYQATVGELLVRQIRDSDNAANDLLIREIGGAAKVEAILARKGIRGIRIGMDEKHLQCEIAGVPWRPEFAGNSGLVDARARLPMAYRQAKFQSYLENPMDGATPVATVKALAALAESRLLSWPSTQRLLAIMREVRTGKRRLKGGLERGWTLGHKTGTGPDLRGVSAGINDVGILTAPDGHAYAVAVFIADTRAPTPERLAYMQKVSELVEGQWAGRLPSLETEPAPAIRRHAARHAPARHEHGRHHRRR